MEVKKESRAAQGGEPDTEQLRRINTLAKSDLKKEDVYVFSLRLCDDQVDRDYERFDTGALEALAAMFLGKSGIVDHQWSAQGQLARIFDTRVVTEGGVSYIKAWAYIRRGGQGDEWIADIEAGIKKEVSVGCAMGRSVCSVCGLEYGSCGHRKGEHYDGMICVAVLKDPVDAYEFSFVAVPAQRDAGVMKALGGGKISLKELAERYGAQEEYRGLFKLAELGREYERALEDEVVRLCLALELGVEERVLRSAVGKMAGDELRCFRKALDQRFSSRYPVRTQLVQATEQDLWDSDYLI